MTSTRLGVLAALLLCAAVSVPAQKTSLFQASPPPVGERDLGIIFNTGDILLGLESYQGGLGGKISIREWHLRALADLGFHLGVNPSTVSLALGGVLEKHVTPGPVSLYWGPSAALGFEVLTNKSDADNWSQTIYLDLLSAGAVFGIEMFIFEFLSMFVEYEADLTLGLNVYRTSVAGSVSSTSDFTADFGLDLGNQAMFGIVFYLQRRDKAWQRRG